MKNYYVFPTELWIDILLHVFHITGFSELNKFRRTCRLFDLIVRDLFEEQIHAEKFQHHWTLDLIKPNPIIKNGNFGNSILIYYSGVRIKANLIYELKSHTGFFVFSGPRRTYIGFDLHAISWGIVENDTYSYSYKQDLNSSFYYYFKTYFDYRDETQQILGVQIRA
ncbi:13807_t:CDS:2, partial [Acaulospora morrowiae]